MTLDRALLIATLALIVAMVLFLLVSTIAIVFRMYLIGSIIQGIAHLPLIRNRLRPNMETVHRFEDLLLEVLHEHPGRLLRIVTAELLAQALLLFEIYWILNTLDLSFPMVYPLVIEAAGKLVSLAFFFIPTQLGATEGTYAIVFNALDLPAAAGFTLAVVRRIRSLLVAGAGLVALWLLTPEKRQSDHGLTDGEP